jgi:hypothetical protein
VSHHETHIESIVAGGISGISLDSNSALQQVLLWLSDEVQNCVKDISMNLLLQIHLCIRDLEISSSEEFFLHKRHFSTISHFGLARKVLWVGLSFLFGWLVRHWTSFLATILLALAILIIKRLLEMLDLFY